MSRSSTKIQSKWVHRQIFQRKNYLGSKKKCTKLSPLSYRTASCYRHSWRVLRWDSHKTCSRGNILLYKLFHAVNFIFRSFIDWKYWKAFAAWNTVEKNCSGVKVCKSHKEKQLTPKLKKGSLPLAVSSSMPMPTRCYTWVSSSFIYEKLISTFLKGYNFSYANLSFPFKHVLTNKKE